MPQERTFEAKKKLIAKITSQLDNSFADAGGELYKVIIEEFVDQLDTKDGEIVNNSRNIRLIAQIDKLYTNFINNTGVNLASQIVQGVDMVSKFNVDYYSEYGSSKAKFAATTKQIKTMIDDRLGLGDRTRLKPGGFMDSMLKDTTVQNQIKNLSLREVNKNVGFKSFKKGLQKLIVGDPERLGALQQHHRNFTYDVFVNVDRGESLMFARDLDLRCFFYEGTLIDTSRQFCKDRAGQLFTIEEALAWEDDPWIKNALEKGYISSYNPITDMGLWACRHVPRFVSDEVAIAIRPELKSVLAKAA